MGLLDGLLGNASEIDAHKLETEFAKVLAAGEQIEKAYQVIRDLFIFTSKRLILVDKQGLTGSKVEYHSLPYRAITHFSIETGGHFDLDSVNADEEYHEIKRSPAAMAAARKA